MLHLYPDLVKIEAFRDYGRPRGRMKALKDTGIESGIRWYADHPEHMRTEAVAFTPEKGEVFVRARVERIVEHIRIVKSTEEPAELYAEFHDRAERPSNG
jgi:creatinine amidohydrolase